MIDIPNNPTNGSTITLGTTKYTYQDGKLTPFMIKQGGTELTSPKLNVETLTEFRHSVSGKPLYTKTIDCGFLPATKTFKVVPLNIVDDYDYVKVVVDASHIIIPNLKDFSFSVLMPWYTLESQIGAYIEADSIVIGVGSGHSNKKAYITVEYTKTADTSSSPVKSLYTGSLNEVRQNVETHAGYKRNGKDVYQIEVDFGFLPNATTKSVPVHNILPTYTCWVDSSKSYVYAGDTLNEYYSVDMPSPINLSWQIFCRVSPKTQSVNIATGADRSFQTARIVINYTK